ncbi:MAG: FGGY-family carbohydrate kinase [Trueperaceae bacterium]|nr:FGGY-family carbohydrate kinase [Trueperaceae bacterium]
MAEVLLGIDVGTYSSKGVLTDLNGAVLKSHVVEHGVSFPQPGWAEQDADAVWWHDTRVICRELLNGAPYAGADVAGVAVSAIGPCLLPLDRDGAPLRPGILYGVDTRASDEIELLNRELGAEQIFEFSGMALTSQAIGPKIRWLQRREPTVWQRTKRLTTASSYLVSRLTGEHVMDRHTASHYMPLMDIAALEWSERYAAAVAPLELLPRLGWSDELAGLVTRAAAAETGLKAGTPVAVGAVDALAEAVSVGATQPGDLMIMYGSTTFFILVLPTPVPDPRTWTTAGAFAGQYALAAGMSTTGSLTHWFRDQLARDLPPEEAFERLFQGVGSVPVGSGGLVLLPYFSGERTPLNDPLARGVIAGLDLTHTREHLFRALLEGVAYGVRHNLETFAALGATPKRIVAVGGGARGSTWLQIVSDVSGQTQLVPEVTLGASYGDAFLAGLAAGVLKRADLSGWVRIKDQVRPVPEDSERYEPYYRDFLRLYAGTAPVVHALASRQRDRTTPA